MFSINKSPLNNFSSGRTGIGTVVMVAVAALIGTVVGGVSVLGVVVAVTNPSSHDRGADTGSRTTAPLTWAAPQGQVDSVSANPPNSAATAAEQNPSAALAPAASQPQPFVAQAPVAPPAPGPRTVWPDALSARAGVVPQANGNDDNAAESDGPPASAPAVAASAPASLPATDKTPTGKARADTKKSRSVRQQRSPDNLNRSGDNQVSAAYPPRRRAIVAPGANPAANEDRDHWGGGSGGLFDVFRQDHWNDHWGNDRWNND